MRPACAMGERELGGGAMRLRHTLAAHRSPLCILYIAFNYLEILDIRIRILD
jgi:hypothetical protein